MKISQKKIHYPEPDFNDFDDGQNRAEQYFSIGHGDFNEEYGLEPTYVVWVWDGHSVEFEKVRRLTDEGQFELDKTHGSIWGHDNIERFFKGRYEPETGRLSIVKPDHMKFRDIPERLLMDLESVFKNIKEINIFD